jgi:1-acyl-sn-glycerol-3-phosphate acyltransferase
MIYYAVRAICWLILKIFWKIEVIGIENLPKEGGLILAANHVSYLDPIVLAITMKRKICFITKKEAFNNIFGSVLLKNLNAFPVDREKVDIRSLKKSLSILEEKKVLGIFPEGTRSKNGKLQELKLGIIKIGMKTGIPILPIGISGVNNSIYSQGKLFPNLFKKYRINVRYGSLLYLDKGKIGDKTYQKEALNALGQKIKELTHSHK